MRKPRLPLDRFLLSLHFAGVYLTANDLIQAGAALGFDFPHKSRDHLMRQFLNDAANAGKFQEATEALGNIINERREHYHALAKAYPGCDAPIQKWLNATQESLVYLSQEATNGEHYV